MIDSDFSWGEIIEKTINLGREDKSSKFKKIKQFDSRYEKFTHCSHVMIYTRTKSIFETFPKKAIILMQMRFDGYIGFPGGKVDNEESPVDTLCREVKEELGWNDIQETISDSNYLFTHVDEDNELVLNFYATEITEVKMEELEHNSTKALDYGSEVLGHFRVPLYVMGDAFRGFPAFLKNNFVSVSKLQLIEAISKLKLLTEEEIIQALYSAPKITF